MNTYWVIAYVVLQLLTYYVLIPRKELKNLEKHWKSFPEDKIHIFLSRAPVVNIIYLLALLLVGGVFLCVLWWSN